MPYHSLLQNALLLDTETLGLQRGAGMHELAIYDLQTSAMHEYILKPNMVQIAAATAQEHTKLATSASDLHRLVRADRWTDILRLQLVMNKHVKPSASDTEVQKALEAANPWLSRRLADYPHLQGRIETDAEKLRRQRMLETRGQVKSFSSKVVDPAELIGHGGDLQKLIAGKTVWGANVAFDSKAIGALSAGLAAEGIPSDLKRSLETAGPSADALYVTGVEVNQARVLAQQTGDWTSVWKAYLAHPPKAGETAVRDIQDVLRAMMSYGQKLGLLEQGDVYWGTGLDVAYRLMGSLEPGSEGMSRLLTKESHRAAEDLAIHSKYILEKAIGYTSLLQNVHESMPDGKDIVKHTADKRAQLNEVASYFARMEQIKPQLKQVSLIKRLGRAQMDLLEQGETWQVDGWRAVTQLTQQTPSGGSVKVPTLSPNRTSMGNMEHLVGFLQAQGGYGNLDIAGEASRLEEAVGMGNTVAEKKLRLNEYLESKTANVIESTITEKAKVIANTFRQDAGATVSRALRTGTMVGQAAQAIPYASQAALLKGWGAFAGAMATAGAVWSMTAGNANPTRESPSLVSYSYDEWLRHQSEFSGQRPREDQNQGMWSGGVGGAGRAAYTDFGSPYQGIMGSQMVFYQQELLQEREKYLREQYGAIHYDPMTGMFGMQGILARARHQGYSYIGDGTPVANGYANLRGEHLMKINLGDGKWKMKVDDADTIMLQRGGLRGAVASIFGLNKQYSFRLSGIDAPETAHAGQSNRWHSPQPHGNAAGAAFQAMLADQKNLELVFNPEETTYGRQMGVMLGDGKNLNYELVRRGQASFLPFGKQSDDMLRWGPLRAMHNQAVASSRGMWQHPYWKAYADVSAASGESITFNTFTQLNKIAQSQSTMDTLSLMEQAQAQGMYSTESALEASRIGKFTHLGADNLKPAITGETAAHYSSYLHEMLSENKKWSSTHGTGNSQKTVSRRGTYGKLDNALVLDSMGHNNSVWSRRRLAAFERYDTGKGLNYTRRQRMAAQQRGINNTLFDSQQKHYEM